MKFVSLSAVQRYKLHGQVRLLALLPDSPLLIVELTQEGMTEKRVVRQSDVCMKRREVAQEPFGVYLLRLENKKRCLEYLQLAKDAYKELY